MRPKPLIAMRTGTRLPPENNASNTCYWGKIIMPAPKVEKEGGKVGVGSGQLAVGSGSGQLAVGQLAVGSFLSFEFFCQIT